MLHVVLAWELGAGFGHLTSIAAFASELIGYGYSVTAIVPKLQPAAYSLLPLAIRVIELPVPAAPPRDFPLSVNYTANLLRNGFWHSETIKQRVQAWQNILNKLDPDLLICDHAPSALLASRDAAYPRVAIGHGFTLPPLSEPMPSLYPWFSLSIEQLQQADQIFLGIVNPVLMEMGIPPLARVAALFDRVERFLCIEPELDHYPIRQGETYWGGIDAVFSVRLEEKSLENIDSGVFIYMSANNRFLVPLLRFLTAKEIPVLAYLSGQGIETVQTSFPPPQIQYLPSLINFKIITESCRAVVVHGGTLSASFFLRQGITLLICPSDLEKAILGTRLQERHLAQTANWFSPQGLSDNQLENWLGADLGSNLTEFSKKHATATRPNPVKSIINQWNLQIS
ncbi:hypothetical protein [Synechococcus sp. PCC 6312]|uniref:hypothetical protein n=1 Tax=Synechococcus sp. (strain ATCC 27167 / PCC 6312) TaxID=195253 RepID=UPI00029EE517|nr:hypothetical protein [Synechococcus sp. PCC 6312]AFY62671.1 hypothetical protein Syn6312_3655 [Synechococcus sp. PCC 6312]